MNEGIKQLLVLQERDMELDKLQMDIQAIPKEIAGIRAQMASEKAALEDSKKELTHVQTARKEKEAELASKEEAVRKHTAELNSIKSNDAYRSMMGEIEKSKREQSILEDEILQLMEKVDQAQKVWRERENLAKSTEGERQKQISDLETKQKSLEEQKAQKQTQRAELATTYPKNTLTRYEQLRGGKKGGPVIVPLKNGQCGGCHMRISPNLENEVKRGQVIMYCEHCSRIVFLEEVAAKPAAS
jgi:predicted  nucleic acid-binding Zn-ribbon protein